MQEFNTYEFINGMSTPIVCRFRKYDTLSDSILDHGRLLSFSRYKSVITSKDYTEACQNVYNSGYSIDDECPENLIAIIEQSSILHFYYHPKSFFSKSSKSYSLCG
ncbi:glucosaminidase domain-containing protein [Clostridium estertheticum]|uniref:glucosaminidase domain-containing protein n=1 Tax=Clostridium estertheticum TaxID=238834 RepID=UPI003A4C8076